MRIQTRLVHLTLRIRLTKDSPSVPMPKPPRVRRLLPALITSVAFAVAQEPAQQAPSQQTGDQNPAETLKVNVNVVQLFFNVKDKHGALIRNLTKDDFEVIEDGKPQTVKYFTAETNLPLTLGILIDSSGSQARVLGMEKEVGGNFLNDILRDKD